MRKPPAEGLATCSWHSSRLKPNSPPPLFPPVHTMAGLEQQKRPLRSGPLEINSQFPLYPTLSQPASSTHRFWPR